MPHSEIRFPLARAAFALLATALAQHAQAAPTLTTAWWNPAEPGWGVFVNDRGSDVVAAWYTNDADGEPTWFLAATKPQADGSYAGDAYRFTGVPLAQIAGPASDPGARLGQLVLRPRSDGRLAFETTIGGAVASKPLERIPFGDRGLVCRTESSAGAPVNYSDLWWNPESSGWGLNLAHVDQTIFALWYTYDVDREAVYYTAAATRGDDGAFRGPLFRVRNGVPYTQIAGAPAGSGSDAVGTVELRFDGASSGTFRYVLGGVEQAKTIGRGPFGDRGEACAAEPYALVPAASSGDGGVSGKVECFPPYAVGDRREHEVATTTNGATTTARHVLEVARSESFEGQSALVEELRVDGTLTGRSFLAASGQDTETASYGADALANGQLVSRSVNEPIRLAVPRRFAVGETYEHGGRVRTTAQGFTVTTTLSERWRLVAVETISTPAGSIEACRFEYRSEVANAQFGLSATFEGTRWSSGAWGLVAKDGTSRATAAGTTTVSSVRERLVSARVGTRTLP